MKKVFLAIAVVVALGTAATASTVYSQLSGTEYQTPQTPQTPAKPATATQQQELPKAVKDAVAKDYPGSTVKASKLDAKEKTYTIDVLQKGAKEATKVTYKETGEKVVKK